jgi:mRNA interferase MazF
MIEKARPVLILSIPFSDADRALVTVVFHTTALRSSQFEVKIGVPFLKEGAFVAQSIATYPTALHSQTRRAERHECVGS